MYREQISPIFAIHKCLKMTLRTVHIHVLVPDISLSFQAGSRKGTRNSMHSSRGSLALPSALTQSLTKQQLDLPSSTLLRTANSECRHAKGFTTRVSQCERRKPDFSRSCRLNGAGIETEDSNDRCAKKKT